MSKGSPLKKLLEYLRLSVSTADMAWKIVTFIVVIGGGTTAGLLAAGSQLFQQAGPLAWLMVALVAGLVISLIVFLVRASQRAGAEASIATAVASKASQVNPLLSSFADLVIQMEALHLPGQQLHKHKQFRRCKFVGPGTVALLGGTFVNSSFSNAGHILTIPENTMLTGVTVFENCTVEDCEFMSVTIMIPRTSAPQFAQIPGVQIAM